MREATKCGADIRRDTPAQAVDRAAHRAARLSHHIDGCALPWRDPREVGLAEIAYRIPVLGVDDREQRVAGSGKLPGSDVERTLNWVRIAARFPVRVLLDAPPDDLMRYGATAVIVIEK